MHVPESELLRKAREERWGGLSKSVDASTADLPTPPAAPPSGGNNDIWDLDEVEDAGSINAPAPPAAPGVLNISLSTTAPPAAPAGIMPPPPPPVAVATPPAAPVDEDLEELD